MSLVIAQILHSDTSLTMQLIDPCNVEYSLEDCTRQQDNFWGLQIDFMWEATINRQDPYSASFSGDLWRKNSFNQGDDYGRIWIEINGRYWSCECHLRCGGRREDFCLWVNQLNTLNCMELIFSTMKMQNKWWKCSWACRLKSSLKMCQRYMNNSPNSFALNTSRKLLPSILRGKSWGERQSICSTTWDSEMFYHYLESMRAS
jgi:hypothetical protein